MERTRKPLSVLVVGATGRQGGAVARALHERGHHVRGLTRRPESPAARSLRASGIAIAAADFADRPSLDRAMMGMDAVFAMGTSVGSTPQLETRQGMALISAAKTARLRHFVYSSIAGADQSTGIPSFESKWRVEQHLRESYLPFTILGPVYLMDNALDEPSVSRIRAGTLSRPLPADCVLQQVAVATVGDFAAWVIDQGQRFFGQRIDLASDELTGPDEARALVTETGHQVSYQASDRDAVEDLEARAIYAWIASRGFKADLKGLRRDYPEVDWLTYSAWAGQNRAALSLATASAS